MSRNADQRRFNEKQAAYFLSSTLLKPSSPRSFQGHDWLEIEITVGGAFIYITYNTCTSSRLTGLDQRNNENKKGRKCRTSAEKTMEFPRLACRKRLRIIYSVLTSGHALLYGQTRKDLVTVLWRLVRFATDTARRPLPAGHCHATNSQLFATECMVIGEKSHREVWRRQKRTVAS